MVSEKENMAQKLFGFFEKSLSSGYIAQNICCFWQLLPLLSKSFYSGMFSDCCPQSHPSYSCLPPRRTRQHIHCHEFVSTPTHKNTSRGSRNSCRLWAKKIREAAAVWVRHSSASSFQFSVTVWETGTERNHYKVQKPVDFLLSTATYAEFWYHLHGALRWRLPPSQIHQKVILFEEPLQSFDSFGVLRLWSGNAIRNRVFSEVWVERLHRCCVKSSGLPSWLIWCNFVILWFTPV